MRCVMLNIVCMIVVLTQVGCRSVYRLKCRSYPMTAGVLLGEQVLGETPCTVEIPKKSELIHDKHVELTFCLPDGREKTAVVDLSGLKPSSPLAEIVSSPFILVGTSMVLLSGSLDDEEVEEDFSTTRDREYHGFGICTGLLGAGVCATGLGLFHVLGGDGDSLDGHKVLVYFDKPAAAGNEGTDGRWSP